MRREAARHCAQVVLAYKPTEATGALVLNEPVAAVEVAAEALSDGPRLSSAKRRRSPRHSTGPPQVTRSFGRAPGERAGQQPDQGQGR